MLRYRLVEGERQDVVDTQLVRGFAASHPLGDLNDDQGELGGRDRLDVCLSLLFLESELQDGIDLLQWGAKEGRAVVLRTQSAAPELEVELRDVEGFLSEVVPVFLVETLRVFLALLQFPSEVSEGQPFRSQLMNSKISFSSLLGTTRVSSRVQSRVSDQLSPS